MEADLFALTSNLTWQGDTRDDNLGNLDVQLTAITRLMDKRQRNIRAMVASFADAPPAIRAEMMALAKGQEADQAVKTKLERQLAALKTAKPADEQLSTIQSLSMRLERLSGQELVNARGKIAAALPTLFSSVRFAPDGIDVTVRDGRVLRLGEWVGGVGPGSVIYKVRGRGISSPVGAVRDKGIDHAGLSPRERICGQREP